MCLNTVPKLKEGKHKTLEPDPGNGTRLSGCQVVDVEFHSPVPASIGCITFQNHYTHTLTLKYCSTTTGQISNSNSDHPPTQWKTCMNQYTLMPNCHYERGSQTLLVLNEKHFHVPLENVCCLRFILRQPSPDWEQFGIRDIHCYLVPSPYHQTAPLGNECVGMGSESMSMSQRMERILQNGLWTDTQDSDLESGPSLPREKLPYEINVLSHT